MFWTEPSSTSLLCVSSESSSLSEPMLIAFANSLDSDRGPQNVGPDLDPNRLPL